MPTATVAEQLNTLRTTKERKKSLTEIFASLHPLSPPEIAKIENVLDLAVFLVDTIHELPEHETLLSCRCVTLILSGICTQETKTLLARLLQSTKSNTTVSLFLLNLSHSLVSRNSSFASITASYLLGLLEIPAPKNTPAQTASKTHTATRLLFVAYTENKTPRLRETIKNTLHDASKKKIDTEMPRKRRKEETHQTNQHKATRAESFSRLIRSNTHPLLGRVVATALMEHGEIDWFLDEIVSVAAEDPLRYGLLLATAVNMFRIHNRPEIFDKIFSRLQGNTTALTMFCRNVSDVDETRVLDAVETLLKDGDKNTVTLVAELARTFPHKEKLLGQLADAALCDKKETRRHAASLLQPIIANTKHRGELKRRCIDAVQHGDIEKGAALFLAMFQHEPALITHLAHRYKTDNVDTKKMVHVAILAHIRKTIEASDAFLDTVEDSLCTETLPFLRPFLFGVAEPSRRLYETIRRILYREGEEESPRILLPVVSEIPKEEMAGIVEKTLSYLNGTADHNAAVRDTLAAIVEKETVEELWLLEILHSEKRYKTHAQAVEGVAVWTRLFKKENIEKTFRKEADKNTSSFVFLEAMASFLVQHADGKKLVMEIFGHLVRKFVFGTDALWGGMIKIAKLLVPDSIPVLLSLKQPGLEKIALTEKEICAAVSAYLLRQPLYIQKKYKMFLEDWLY
ncbi:MAG: uncharacterized protein A8A55_0818 [Amphiamblys sp. WSBS2006]|nr:MAG: uncharacterized protein A8A55_0818 [Amphiamblys sp. WSBS2006]